MDQESVDFYNATQETRAHIHKVSTFLEAFRNELKNRALKHDQSKLEEPELSTFTEWTPKLSAMEYGSAEYKHALSEMGPALDHHYQHNSHHPEHYANGVTDMNLFDLLEMLADWKAAGERVSAGSMDKSLKYNVKRFKIPRGLALVIANTAKDLGWIESVNSKEQR